MKWSGRIKRMPGMILLLALSWTAHSEQVLNNFVSVLLETRVDASSAREIAFDNPREGWICLRFEGTGAGGTISVRLDGSPDPVILRRHPVTGALEAMQFLSEGGHTLGIDAEETLRVRVSSVPEIAFCYYPSSNHIAAYGPYTWRYMERHVLSEVNTLVSGAEAPAEEKQQWLSEGRRWVANAHLPGIADREPPDSESVCREWASNRAVTGPGYHGLIVDEFIGASRRHYKAWAGAVTQLHAHPGMAGKTFYAWCGSLYETPWQKEFGSMLMRLNGRFVWETYLCEEDTEARAAAWMDQHLAGGFLQWKEAFPGVEKRMVMCLGYLSAPPESLNRDPGVDYHVFMDMQFHVLATHPAFKGLYGLMEYMAAYADEESLQYAHRLIRHYCIEGSTARMNRDPYSLTHLKNPDFEAGLEHWQVTAAEEASVTSASMEKFSWLQGRYPETAQGDTFCVMKRSPRGPNLISQPVTHLEPGRLYSVKLISANLDTLALDHKTTLAMEVEGGEVLPHLAFQCLYPSCYSHETETYTRDHPARFCFHRIVFRAKAPEALLKISDGQPSGDTADIPGSLTAFNFVEVQPCHLE